MKIDTINIYAKHGEKVCYLFPLNGTSYDQEEARNKLELGAWYTVDYTNVFSFSSTVCLQEFPDMYFNTVLFGQLE